MKHGEPITKPYFDWEKAKEAQEHTVDDAGNVNWKAAMLGDPGVVRCKACDEYLWDEALIMRCPCGSLAGRGADDN